MFKIFLLVLGLAGYGAYSLLEKFSPRPQLQAAAPVHNTTIVHIAGGATAAPTAESAASSPSLVQQIVPGLQLEVVDLPAQGCQAGALTAERFNELLSYVPEAQRTLIANALNMSRPMWSAQLYQGSLGMGVCLPDERKLVLLPSTLPSIAPAMQLFNSTMGLLSR